MEWFPPASFFYSNRCKMNLSNFQNETLLSRLDEVIEENGNNEPPRDYLGASAVGDVCSRRQWYKLQGHQEQFKARTLRLFQDGHDTEAKILSWLHRVPEFEVYDHNDGEQYGFSDLGGRYKGHYDGIIRGIPEAPKTWHILEVKTTAEKHFRAVERLIEKHGEKAALEAWRPEYYAQAMTYCWYEKLTRHITIISTPGGRDLLTIRTNSNHIFAKSLRDKAQRILEATQPPVRISDRSDWYQCKMCSFNKMCHEGEK